MTPAEFRTRHTIGGRLTGADIPTRTFRMRRAVQYDNRGWMDFLLDAQNDVYALGYYTKPDRPISQCAGKNYTVCDRYFCSSWGRRFRIACSANPHRLIA